MTNYKRYLLFLIIAALLLFPFILAPLRQQVQSPADPNEFTSDFVEGHHRGVRELIATLKKENLQQSFSGLKEEGQYLNPGSHSEGIKAINIESVLSARRFLKVWQEFQALSKQKKQQFLDSAKKECKELLSRQISTMQAYHERYFDTGNQDLLPKLVSLHGIRHTFITTMLMAVHLGDKETVFDLYDHWQHCRQNQKDYMDAHPNLYPHPEIFVNDADTGYLAFEADGFLTILLHLTEKLQVRSEEVDKIKQECEKNKATSMVPNAKEIPLVKWDALDSYYDLAVWSRGASIDPSTIVENFTVYSFPGHLMLRPVEQQKRFQTIRQALMKEK
ncbi:hypothetical protein FACS189443_6470 [Planctomycetales bacterium]|nr:hypothetical protein FACS189443_6470 [Planctomycetales bacterium]